jgi:endogenous inhibitor of DNA gyrase (YacG/DUF329 family)
MRINTPNNIQLHSGKVTINIAEQPEGDLIQIWALKLNDVHVIIPASSQSTESISLLFAPKDSDASWVEEWLIAKNGFYKSLGLLKDLIQLPDNKVEICPICGKSIERDKRPVLLGDIEFCSEKCADEYINENGIPDVQQSPPSDGGESEE